MEWRGGMFLTANCSKTVGRFEVSGTAVSYLQLAQLNINGNF